MDACQALRYHCIHLLIMMMMKQKTCEWGGKEKQVPFCVCALLNFLRISFFSCFCSLRFHVYNS